MILKNLNTKIQATARVSAYQTRTHAIVQIFRGEDKPFRIIILAPAVCNLLETRFFRLIFNSPITMHPCFSAKSKLIFSLYGTINFSPIHSEHLQFNFSIKVLNPKIACEKLNLSPGVKFRAIFIELFTYQSTSSCRPLSRGRRCFRNSWVWLASAFWQSSAISPRKKQHELGKIRESLDFQERTTHFVRFCRFQSWLKNFGGFCERRALRDKGGEWKTRRNEWPYI